MEEEIIPEIIQPEPLIIQDVVNLTSSQCCMDEHGCSKLFGPYSTASYDLTRLKMDCYSESEHSEAMMQVDLLYTPDPEIVYNGHKYNYRIENAVDHTFYLNVKEKFFYIRISKASSHKCIHRYFSISINDI